MTATLGLLLTFVALLPLVASAADGDALFDAIRRADTAAIERLLRARLDPNAKDASGTPALMHAAVYASDQELRLLLDAGADVNAANAYGSTALMWAAGDAAKVRLLLDRGASPVARAVDRTTPLLAAARFGNVESMRLLLERGADPKATTGDAVNLLRAAFGAENRGRAAMRQLLAAHGVTPQSVPAALEAPVLANNVHDPATVRALLEAGADPKQEMQVVTLKIPTLAVAASAGAEETMRLLVARGADVDAPGTRGWTPLMYAVAAQRPSAAAVRLLLASGADLHARDEDGRTALDWALMQANVEVVEALRAAGATSAAPPVAAPPAVRAPRSARSAVEAALARLQPAGQVFNEHTRCVSCHHQSIPQLAVRAASERGVRVDATLAKHPTEATLTMYRGAVQQLLLGGQGFGGFVPNASYGLAAMADEGVPPNAVTDAVALRLAALQAEDGSWDLPVGSAGGGIRPPLTGDPFLTTALVVRGLSAYAPPGARADVDARIHRARQFLRTGEPTDTQGAAFKLAGLVWSKAPSSEIDAQSRRVLALQRENGGWGQLPTMASDAYATGQALYALHLAGTTAGARAYRMGADYLLRTQLDDGTWHVRSRGFGFQPYFETGFPHGRDQFLSAAATAWAALTLALIL